MKKHMSMTGTEDVEDNVNLFSDQVCNQAGNGTCSELKHYHMASEHEQQD